MFTMAQHREESKKQPNKLYTNYSGLEVKMIKMVGEVLNFKTFFQNPADLKWGAINKNGTGFTGMVRCFQTKH